jgi:hypothetical protein
MFTKWLQLTYVGISVLYVQVLSYSGVYIGIHNSLKYSLYLILLTLPIFIWNIVRLKRIAIKLNLELIILCLGFFQLIIDLMIFTEINKYKFDTYCLIYFILFFRSFAKSVGIDKLKVLIYFNLATWLAINMVEYYLRQTQPELFTLVWSELTLQTSLNESDLEVKKIHGFGISTQANIVAVLSLIVLIIFDFFEKRHWLLKMFMLIVLLLCFYFVPYSLSLTAIAALLISVLILLTKLFTNLNSKFLLNSLMVLLLLGFPLFFLIGDYLNFSANSSTKSDYTYEFIEWPVKYTLENFISVLSGFNNNIVDAPLENRYFNIILTNGLLFFVLLLYFLSKEYMRLLDKAKFSLGDKTKFLVFSIIVISYMHISFIPIISSLILLTQLFCYSVLPKE